MVLIKKFTLIFAVVLFIQAQQSSEILKKGSNSLTKVLQTYRFEVLPNDGSYTLEMNNLSGNVNIVGHENSSAKITITNIVHRIPKKEIQKAHQISKTIVKNLKNHNKIQIKGISTKENDDKIEKIIEMALPKNLNLNFQLLGGDIDLYNINGEAIIETLGGNILLKNYTGRIEIKTNGGDINISNVNGNFRGHSFGGNIRISQSNGEIYSSCIGGNIHMNDLNGKITSQTSGGSINLLKIQGTEINCNASGGLIDCKNISGKIILKNSGEGINIKNASGNLDLISTGGSIFLDEVKGTIKCKASIGVIKMSNISGKVESLNSNGNIFLELLYDSSIKDFGIHLETHSGDVNLDIPKGLPGSITSTVYKSKSYKDINAEMPLNITTFHDKVIGKRKMKEGTIPINLEVHGGIITIKEY